MHSNLIGNLQTCAIQPWVGNTSSFLEFGNLVDLLEGKTNFVESVQETHFSERIHFEAEGFTVRSDNLLVGKVDLELVVRIGSVLKQDLDLLAGQSNRAHSIVETVASVDHNQRHGRI